MTIAYYRVSRGCQPVASVKRSWLTGSMSSHLREASLEQDPV